MKRITLNLQTMFCTKEQGSAKVNINILKSWMCEDWMHDTHFSNTITKHTFLF